MKSKINPDDIRDAIMIVMRKKACNATEVTGEEIRAELSSP